MVRLLLLLTLLVTVNLAQAENNPPVVVFAGTASQPPLEEAAQTFQANAGIPVILHQGGSGAMLNQILLSGQGDIYIPGSHDYMQKAIEFGLIAEEPVTIAFLVPALIVAKGNPSAIYTLDDLQREGLRIGIADPDGVCVGLYAIEILYANNLLGTIRPNLKGMVESCAKAAAMVPLKLVDVVIGWREFAAWRPDVMDAVLLKPTEIPRLAYIPAAPLSHAANPAGAAQFLAFLASEEGRSIFRKWGYYTEEAEVRHLAPDAKIGGEFKLPEGW